MLELPFQRLFVCCFPLLLADKYQLTNIANLSRFLSIFRHKIQITKGISVINNIFSTLTIKPTLQKRFFLLVMLKRLFHTTFLRNILLNLLEQRNCSLSSLYLEHSIEAIILYPYFVCKCIELFLLKSFTLL